MAKIEIIIFYSFYFIKQMTPTAELMERVITMYNMDKIEYWSHSHMVNHGLTGVPYMKHYYKIDLCSQVLSFYKYYFPEDEDDFYRHKEEDLT
jgi:hypothetical protein